MKKRTYRYDNNPQSHFAGKGRKSVENGDDRFVELGRTKTLADLSNRHLKVTIARIKHQSSHTDRDKETLQMCQAELKRRQA